MKKIDWDSAPEWAITVIADRDGEKYWAGKFGTKSVRQRVGNRRKDDEIADMTTSFHSWSLIEERPSEWAGEGLPPIGTVCEITMGQGWHPLTVLFVGESYLVGMQDGREQHYYLSTLEFRPIKTPEQIAEEEREHAVRNACTDIARTLDPLKDYIPSSNAAIAVVRAMIDAGYRKPKPE